MRQATSRNGPLGLDDAAAVDGKKARFEERPVAGMLRRTATLGRHLGALWLAACAERVQRAGARPRPGLGLRMAALLARVLLAREALAVPFAHLLRQRLEQLGPAFIKLGQMLAVRRDLLPREVTSELGGLLDQLPAVDFDRFRQLLTEGLGRAPEELFAWIESQPIGSASIAQIHRAGTHAGDAVIIKVVKPGIRQTLERDARLLRMFGRLLQITFARFQPRRVIEELVTYTLYEVDMRREAENAETFAAHFADLPDIVFPRVYRHLSSDSVLTMELFAGVRPDSRAARDLSRTERARIIDLGAQAIVRMIYRDGFFHADLHPGNLLVLKGPRAGFIDLGMVGKLGPRTRKTLLSYFYCLVMGDAEGAARYLASVAEPQRGADPEGFRRAAAETSQRFQRSSAQAPHGAPKSLAQLILESIALGGRYRMFFPVEMVLMVKALVTFEGVGNLLEPGFDVAAVSRRHVAMVLLEDLHPLRVARDGLHLAPELIDALASAPLLVTEGLRLLERGTAVAASPPRRAASGGLFGGLCVLAGAVVVAGGGPWPLAGALFAAGAAAWLRG